MTVKVVWSQDDLLSQEVVDEAVAALPSDGEAITIDGDVSIDGIEEAVFAGSLFSTEKLVVVRNAQALRKADVERLASVLSAGGLPADVIVIATAERSPTQLMNALKGVGQVVRLARPRRGELVNWVNLRMKRAGIVAGRDVGASFVEAVGENLLDLAQAIDQVALRVGRGGRVERKDVLEHFTPQTEQPIWVLFDAIVRHEGTKAFESLRRLLARGDEPLPVLGALISQIRGIMRTKSVIEQSPNLRDADIAKMLGFSEGRVGVMRRQCARLSWDWLVQVHRLCAQADFELKGGEDGAVLPGDVIIERVVAGALDAG